ncbi:MAG TPA: transcription-repair coupling factor, partial [Thermodesulfobacteriota bacterium]
MSIQEKPYSISEAVKDAAGLSTGNPLRVTGLYGSSRAYLLAAVFRSVKRPVLAVLPDQESADAFAGDLKFFLGPDDVLAYPQTEVLPFEPLAAHQDIQAQRMEVLFSLLSKKTAVVVTPAPNLMQRVTPRESLGERVIIIRKNEEVERDSLVTSLQEAGYSRMTMVEDRGDMSVRGGILDIFPPIYDSPLRIEFFGDEVESIRTFDVATQRSLKEMDEARILPSRETTVQRSTRIGARERLIERAEELGLKREAWEPLSDRLREGTLPGLDSLLPLFHKKLDTIFDYLKEGALVALIEPELVQKGLEAFGEEIESAAERISKRSEFFVEPESLYIKAEDALASLSKEPLLKIEALRGDAAQVHTESNLDIRQEISFRKGEELLKPLSDRVAAWIDSGQAVYITAHNRGQAERTRELLEGYSLRPVFSNVDITEIKGPGLYIATGSLSTGFRLPSESLVIVSEEEVFGERVKRRAPPSRKLEAFLTQLQ